MHLKENFHHILLGVPIIITIVLIKQQTKIIIMNNLITRIVLSLKNRETRKQYLIMLTLYLLMFINEAYMHYEVYVTHYTPFACGMAFYYWGMDIIVILFFFNLVTWGRRKLAFILSFCFLLHRSNKLYLFQFLLPTEQSHPNNAYLRISEHL